MSSHGDSRRPLVCYHCKQPGHHIRDCPTRSQAQPSTTPLPPTSAASTEGHLKKLLIAIGEQSVNSVERNLALLSTTLLSELPTHRSFILSTLLHCVKALPAKHNIFACLTALIALQAPTFASDLLTLLTLALPHSLAHAQHNETRILLRFLASLTHTRILSPTSLYSLLTSHFLTFIDAASDSTSRDFYLYTLVSLVPWLGVEHATDPAFTSLLSALTLRMQRRPPPTPLARVFTSDDSEDLLAAYWAAVQAAAARGGEQPWRTELIMRPHLKLAATFAPLIPQDLVVDLPTPASSPSPPSLPPLLHLFPDHPVSAALSPTSLSHYVVYTELLDVLVVFESMHKEATRHLLLLPTGDDYAPHLISLLFSSLFTLPTPFPLTPPTIYYAAIILDLFRLEPKVMPPIIGLAINSLFERLDSVDMEAFDRCVAWFALHLSNFSFTWPWDNWSAVLETDEYTAQRVFVSDCFERMVRLSFWERIQQTIPEELIALMPHQPIPAFRFGGGGGGEGRGKEGEEETKMEEEEVGEGEGGGGAGGEGGGLNAVARSVMDKLREKVSNEDLIAYLTSSLASTSSLSSPLQLLTPCLLHAGHKSYSHLFALFDRYTPTLTHFISLTLASAPLHLVTAITEYWQHSHQHTLVVLDRVMDKGWVQPGVVVGWALGTRVEAMQAGWVWEVVSLAMDRVMERRREGGAEGEEGSGGKEGEAVDAVRALLVGLTKVLRVGGKHEGLLPYLESRTRGMIRKYREVVLPAAAEMGEVVAQLDARAVEALEQAAML